MAEVKSRPILFSGAMVRALLDGSKTQTRRVVKNFPEYEKGTIAPQEKRGEPKKHEAPYFDNYRNGKKTETNPRGESENWCWWDEYDRMGNGWLKCPYGKPGDRLWVREAWWHRKTEFIEQAGFEGGMIVRMENGQPSGFHENREFNPSNHPNLWAKKSPRFMPRWASRIELEIVSVRVERLNDISQADCIAEGGPPSHPSIDSVSRSYGYPDFPRSWYAQLWESINGKGSWMDDPFVWVIEFKRVEP